MPCHWPRCEGRSSGALVPGLRHARIRAPNPHHQDKTRRLDCRHKVPNTSVPLHACWLCHLSHSGVLKPCKTPLMSLAVCICTTPGPYRKGARYLLVDVDPLEGHQILRGGDAGEEDRMAWCHVMVHGKMKSRGAVGAGFVARQSVALSLYNSLSRDPVKCAELPLAYRALVQTPAVVNLAAIDGDEAQSGLAVGVPSQLDLSNGHGPRGGCRT